MNKNLQKVIKKGSKNEEKAFKKSMRKKKGFLVGFPVKPGFNGSHPGATRVPPGCHPGIRENLGTLSGRGLGRVSVVLNVIPKEDDKEEEKITKKTPTRSTARRGSADSKEI